MEEKFAREMFPVWASGEAVRILDEPTEQETIPTRLLLTLKKEKFIKDHGILIAVAMIGLFLSVAVGVITGTIVKRNTEREVEIRMRGEFQAYLEQQEQERRAAQFLTGDSSLNAAIEDLTKSLSVHVASLRMERNVTKKGAEVYAWVDCARLASGLYGKTIEDVLNNKDNSVEGYIPGHAVRNEDTEIARRVATDYLNGKYPDRYYTGMQFAVINADGSVTARDMLFTNHKTRYWPMEGDE